MGLKHEPRSNQFEALSEKQNRPKYFKELSSSQPFKTLTKPHCYIYSTCRDNVNLKIFFDNRNLSLGNLFSLSQNYFEFIKKIITS